MAWHDWLNVFGEGPRPATREEYSVIGCFGFFLFLGTGLLGLGFLLVRRLRGAPPAQESMILLGSLTSIGIAVAIPVVKAMVERLFED
jgi:hypothetical protein